MNPSPPARPAVAGATAAPARIPDAFLDLAECPRVVALSTLMPDGRPQTSVVWCDHDGTFVRVNCMRGFLKERNMRRDPRATLLCFDPREPLRYLEIRGVVSGMTEDGALEHLDELASKYMGRPVRYFGECVAADLAATETPVLCRIRPTHVVARDFRGPGGGTGTTGRAVPGPIPSSTAPVSVPDSHLDLVGAPNHGVLTTILPGGQPQSSLVWLDYDGACVLVNTTLEREKGRNMLANPKVSLLVVDAGDTCRYLQVRGDAELVREGALAHLDELTRRYTRHPAYYGHVFPFEQRERETRVIVRIHPVRISLDAIHR